jgi:hypothetical protein
MVYYSAAVGIVYNKETHSQKFFLGHTDDIMCLAIHPERHLVATGQVGLLQAGFISALQDVEGPNKQPKAPLVSKHVECFRVAAQLFRPHKLGAVIEMQCLLNPLACKIEGAFEKIEAP